MPLPLFQKVHEVYNLLIGLLDFYIVLFERKSKVKQINVFFFPISNLKCIKKLCNTFFY